MSTRKRRKITRANDWTTLLSNMCGPGLIICEFVAAEYMSVWSSQFSRVGRHAIHLASQRLYQLFGLPDIVFKEFTDTAYITGEAVCYSLTAYLPKPADIHVYVARIDVDNVLAQLTLIPGFRIDLSRSTGPDENTYLTLTSRITIRVLEQNMTDTLKGFRIDYMKCYYHKGQFGGFACAKQALRTQISTLPSFGSIVDPTPGDGPAWRDDTPVFSFPPSKPPNTMGRAKIRLNARRLYQHDFRPKVSTYRDNFKDLPAPIDILRALKLGFTVKSSQGIILR